MKKLYKTPSMEMILIESEEMLEGSEMLGDVFAPKGATLLNSDANRRVVEEEEASWGNLW